MLSRYLFSLSFCKHGCNAKSIASNCDQNRQEPELFDVFDCNGSVRWRWRRRAAEPAGECQYVGGCVDGWSRTLCPRSDGLVSRDGVVHLCDACVNIAMSSNSNIVVEWLRSLHLGQYAESFLDNGYDDLEICKQVGDPDLDAIGVFNPQHRNRLLQSVRTLREEGAASVYFTLEESQAIQEECQCDSASARSSRASSGRVSDKDVLGRSPAGSSSAGSAQELTRYLDEYEEGKAELVRIPRIQLKMLLREKLQQDGIRLSNQPYSTSVSL